MIVKIVNDTKTNKPRSKFFQGNQITIMASKFVTENTKRTVAADPDGVGLLELSQILLEHNDPTGCEGDKPCLVISMVTSQGWKQIATNGVVYLLNDSGDTIETFYTKG